MGFGEACKGFKVLTPESLESSARTQQAKCGRDEDNTEEVN